jgi:hypothetical protein
LGHNGLLEEGLLDNWGVLGSVLGSVLGGELRSSELRSTELRGVATNRHDTLVQEGLRIKGKWVHNQLV